MNSFLTLSEKQRKMVFEQTAAQMHLPVVAIEKDFWVTEILNILFSLSYADKMVFKGGTSLSKVWGVIQRFSEDIDIAIDRNLFELDGDVTKKQLKKLRKESSVFVRDVFANDLKMAVKEAGIAPFITIVPEPDGEGNDTYPEPRQLHIKYNSVLETEYVSYLRDEVLLEVGARSLFEPTASSKVISFVEKTFPQFTSNDRDVQVVTALAEKTFLEKVFLLHELFSSGKCENANRKSRHLYDLCKMFEAGIAEKAIVNRELWETIRHHRKIFTSIQGVDYASDIHKRICLTPPDRVSEQWREDYDSMVANMIYEDSVPTFNAILEVMKVLENSFHQS